jgi:dipeptidyl aminopeptidase/acylaminoacyl peptidase
MTAFDRIEPRLPELMAELAPASVPDYFDDMLRQTGRTRQRPAWASLERWLPMDVVARPAPFRAPVLRPLIVLVIIGLLVAAGLAVYAGSQQSRLPAPFGPARNGAVVVSIRGDIAAVDPETGALTTLIAGPTNDVAPWFSRDGQHFLYLRILGGQQEQWIANADGSNQRQLVPASAVWVEWAPEGDRLVVTRTASGGGEETSIMNVADGTSTPLNSTEVRNPSWRPGHDQLIFSTDAGESRQFHVINADGTGLRRIEGVSADAINDPVFSPDGSSLVYATWADGVGLQGRIHVVDIDSGVDRVLMFEGSEGTNEFPYQFSPDGSQLLVERHGGDASFEVNGEQGYRLVLVPASGEGPVTPIGPAMPTSTDGASAEFSPDGTQVLAFYHFDRSTWLLEADGSGGEEVDWNPEGASTWQRLAP